MQYVCVDCGFRSCISIAGQIGIAMQDFHAKFNKWQQVLKRKLSAYHGG